MTKANIFYKKISTHLPTKAGEENLHIFLFNDWMIKKNLLIKSNT